MQIDVIRHYYALFGQFPEAFIGQEPEAHEEVEAEVSFLSDLEGVFRL
jgi:hypothetical protein